jgi:hypothetical protein
MVFDDPMNDHSPTICAATVQPVGGTGENLILPAVQPADLSLKGQGKRPATVKRASNTVGGDFSGILS